MRRRIVLLVIVVIVLFAVASCGDDDSPAQRGDEATTEAASQGPGVTASSTTSSTTAVPAFPVQLAHDAGTATVAARPDRIAALSATHVEMLFALGVGDRVIAGDLFSDHPPEAASLEQLDSFNLNVEALIDLDPDLVILSFDPGEAVSALEAVGLPVLLMGTPSDLEAVYEQITALGSATGASDAAADLVAELAKDVAAIVESTGDRATGVAFYHETDPFSFFTPNSNSFIGGLYGLLGMENIADAAPDEFGGGFPQLSPEFIVESDPDVIYLAGGASAEDLAARPGWESMSAVEQGHVVELDEDIASRWGPRLVDLLESIVAGLPVSNAGGD